MNEREGSREGPLPSSTPANAAADISIQAREGTAFPAYFRSARDVASAPGVIVLQEIFGLTRFVRAVVDRLAEAGYNAIAPDLFWRQGAGVVLDPQDERDRERAGELMRGVQLPQALDDCACAAAYLRGLPGASGKVAALGYCFGGMIAYRMAVLNMVDAAISYYGVGIQNALDRAPEIRVPMLLHMAGEDHLCPPAAQAEIARAFASNSQVRIVTHDGVGHAFARCGAPVFVAAAAEAANRTTELFLRGHLGE